LIRWPNWLEKANFLWENEEMAESKKIKDLPEDERPREKLLKFGAEKLSDAELLAILLRTGVKGKSVLELAKEILEKSGGSFKGLAGKDIEEIMSIPGIKKDKITTLAAALEIARRISKQILKEKGII
jgi:DNA repair protein RadC